MVSLHRLATDLHLGAEQADVAHVVLGAGVRAAGEVDVHRLVERHARVEPAHELDGVALGVGAGELAIGAAGAGDEAALQVRLPPIEPDLEQRLLGGLDIGVADVRQDEVLPDGQPDLAGSVEVRDLRETAHLFGRELADRDRGTDPVQSLLLLCEDADVRMRDGRGPRIAVRGPGVGRDADERLAQEFLRLGEVLVERPSLEQMLEARLLAVAAVAVGDVDPEQGGGDLEHVVRLHQDAEVAGEGLVAGRPAERDAEVDALRDLVGEDVAVARRRRSGRAADPDGLEADVVGVLDRRDLAAAVEGDVELARQVVELAVVEDELTERVGQRKRVDELVRVHAAGGVAGEVADVVRAGPARVQADALDAADELHGVLRLDEPHLQVGPRGDLDVAAGEPVGDVGELAELEAVELAARDAQARHVGLLVRREVEEALPLEAEGVLLVRSLAGGGVLEQEGIRVERMQLAFDALLGDEVVEVRKLGRGGGGGHDVAEGEAAVAEAGEEAVQVCGLFAGELLAGDLGEWQGAHGQ